MQKPIRRSYGPFPLPVTPLPAISPGLSRLSFLKPTEHIAFSCNFPAASLCFSTGRASNNTSGCPSMEIKLRTLISFISFPSTFLLMNCMRKCLSFLLPCLILYLQALTKARIAAPQVKCSCKHGTCLIARGNKFAARIAWTQTGLALISLSERKEYFSWH